MKPTVGIQIHTKLALPLVSRSIVCPVAAGELETTLVIFLKNLIAKNLTGKTQPQHGTGFIGFLTT